MEWLQEVAVTFFFLVFTLICGPPKIILPRAPQSVRPGLKLQLSVRDVCIKPDLYEPLIQLNLFIWEAPGILVALITFCLTMLFIISSS